VKSSVQPEIHNVCFRDVSTGRKFLTKSTLRSKEKEVIDGVEYFVFNREVTSDSHPAYTGEKRFVDSAGRVERFQTKFSRRRG
jgi:large subunit ribosomal protein L31